jgi:pre-60S factor REI1
VQASSSEEKAQDREARVIANGDPKATAEPVASGSSEPALALDTIPEAASAPPTRLTVDADADEDEVMETIDQKIAAARSRLSPSDCLFCSTHSHSLEDNLAHMLSVHSFFVPDVEYLVNSIGLFTYLGEKVAVGNVCVYCGRDFRTLDAVRKHMVDKRHCKLGYETESQRMEIADYYDFSSSYPDVEARAARRAARKVRKDAKEAARAEKREADGEWEEVEDDGSADEVVEESATEPSESGTESDEDEDALPDNDLAYGDSHLELVLPSGARIGHRSLRRYYAQSFRPRGSTKPEDPNSGAALVRRLIGDKNSDLVPRRGGFGAFGQGTDVVKARNRGEAREAGRHIREFRDQARREQYKTRVAFVHNHQKHYRDPLLQVWNIFFSNFLVRITHLAPISLVIYFAT